MKVRNNAVLTGVVASEPKLRKTRYGTHYVIFDFAIRGIEYGDEIQIQCACWNSSLAERFTDEVAELDPLLIMGYLSEYVNQHSLQFVLTSFESTEMVLHTCESVDHTHLICPVTSSEVKTKFDSKSKYLSLNLEVGKSKTCLCVSDDSLNIDKAGVLKDNVGIIRYWADISGKVDKLSTVTGQKDSELGIIVDYLDIIPEYDEEILGDAMAGYYSMYDY